MYEANKRNKSMDIDTLIFILVFLTVAISNIKKIISESRKKKDAQTPEQPEKTDFLQRLVKKFVSRIQDEIAPQSRGARSSEVESGRLSGWGAIMDEDHRLATSQDDQGDQDEGEEDDYVPLELDETEPEISPDISAPPEPLPENVLEPEIESEPEEKRERTPAYSVNELQKAVVWSEILSPPVGLREE